MRSILARATDWDRTRLVVFDVDGTLYRQAPLRFRIACDMVRRSILERDLTVPFVVMNYRRVRERLGDEEVAEFDGQLIEETVRTTGCPAETVRSIVQEWIEERPLEYIARCRYPGLLELVAGLRRRGKVIGVLSDYPAHAKLTSLGFAADYVVTAVDDGIGRLKPHPQGLRTLMSLAGAKPDETVLIGDRPERDGLVARRVGAHALIRSSKPIPGWDTFSRFDDPVFSPLL